jgi:XTP/dITP diphosphohydrolase
VGNRQLVLASHNPGKLREMRTLLGGLPFEIVPQSRFTIPEVAETGLSFIENAILKARHAADYAGLAAIADDSGLEVDALNGAPGIYSARYAGRGASDAENLQKLLTELADIPEEKRGARFRCVIAFMRHGLDPAPVICEGVWEGRILFAPRGKNGFGYDPVFLVPTHHCSSAELEPDIKNAISHRGQALKNLISILNRHLIDLPAPL